MVMDDAASTRRHRPEAPEAISRSRVRSFHSAVRKNLRAAGSIAPIRATTASSKEEKKVFSSRPCVRMMSMVAASAPVALSSTFSQASADAAQAAACCSEGSRAPVKRCSAGQASPATFPWVEKVRSSASS